MAADSVDNGLDMLGDLGAPAVVAESASARMGDIGSTGLRRIGGYVDEEFIRDLRGIKAVKAYREIAENSPIAGGIILGYQNVATHLDWHIEEDADSEGADKEAVQFITEAFEDLDQEWDSILSQIMHMIIYGWSYHEILYKKRDGKASKYTDGKIGWANFPVRSQDSLLRWIFAPNGDTVAMVQLDPNTGRQITIPAWKALLFRTTEYKNNPEGKSLLRSAYVPYQYVRRIQEYEAIGVERDLAGMPVVWLPVEWMNSKDPEIMANVAKMIQMVKDVRRNEREGLVLPQMYEPDLLGQTSHNKALDFELLSSSGARQFDTDKIITRYNTQIGMSLLADFLTMGHEGVGSFALGTAKLDLWIMVVDSLCKSVAETFTREAIKKLLDLNGVKYKALPKLVYGEVENVDLDIIGNFVKTISDAGLLTPDEGTERWLREKASMPPVEVEGPPPGVQKLEMAQTAQDAQIATQQAIAAGKVPTAAPGSSGTAQKPQAPTGKVAQPAKPKAPAKPSGTNAKPDDVKPGGSNASAG